MIRHDDEIEEDAADRIWALMGQIGHKILERANTDNHLPEERLTAQVLGWTLSGAHDLLTPEMSLDDYKFTSVWAVKDEKKEWTSQANVNAWLWRQHGFEVKRARIIAILRDWSKMKASREPDYPQVGVVVREVPLWSEKKQIEYIEDRVMRHQVADSLGDDQLPPCTDEERWAKPDTWAVKKKGNKRAQRVFSTQHEAVAYLDGDWKTLALEPRPGNKTVRCDHYCAAAQFCNQYKSLKSSAPAESEDTAA
jgi:hypothetical protein